MIGNEPAQPFELFPDKGSRTSAHERKERPLITFVVYAYNQAQFIRAAVEGAFSQTYSPLEIILSDDCSSDRTFEIIETMANSYAGPHKICLNKNNKNLGIAMHVCKLFGMSNGELVVFADGDDISVSERTYVLFEYWQKYNRPSALQSQFLNIDKSGKILTSDFAERKPGVAVPFFIPGRGSMLLTHVRGGRYSISGCAEAFTRDVFNIFGDYPSDVISEDAVISFRALCLNGILYVPEALVSYRSHEGNICNTVIKNKLIRSNPELREERVAFLAKMKYSIMKSNRMDLKTAISKGIIDNSIYIDVLRAIEKRVVIFESIKNWWSFSYFKRFFILFPRICAKGNLSDRKWAVARLLPYPLFIYLKRIRNKLKKASREL